MSDPANTPAVPAPIELPALPFEEQRRFARRDCKLRARVTIAESLDITFAAVREFDVTVRNISRGGVCFLFFRQLYPDDRVTFDFGDLVRSYRITRCRRLQTDVYEIGATVLGEK